MQKYNQIMKKLLPALRDVVGIDFGTSATKVVRIKANQFGAKTVVAADILPPVAISGEDDKELTPISVPSRLAAWTAMLTYTSKKALVKLVGEPKGTTYSEKDIPELMGLPKEHDFRIGMTRFDNGEDKSLLIIGVPQKEIVKLPGLLPSDRPISCSAEVSGLSSLQCYCDTYGDEATEGCDLVMDIGFGVTTLGLFVHNVPLVVRRFTDGFSTVANAVMRDFQTDEATARDIVLSGQIDISSTLHNAFGGILRQAGIAVDFTERRTGARLARTFVCGGFARSENLRAEIKAAFSIDPIIIDPWKGMTVLPNAVSAAAKDSGACFAAATSAAVACLEEK